jgi:hypothetical protein
MRIGDFYWLLSGELLVHSRLTATQFHCAHQCSKFVSDSLLFFPVSLHSAFALISCTIAL